MRSKREALRRFTHISALLIVCLIFGSAGFAQETAVDARHGSGHGHNNNKVDFWLTVVHNNDGESQLINAGAGLEDFGGIARFATLVKKLRKEGDKGNDRSSITLNSGDNFLAGPEFNASLQKGIPFYDSIAFDKIGFDAMAIGNHEFDFGPDVLEDFILGFKNPPFFVTDNLDFSLEPGLQGLADDGIIVKRAIIEKGGEKIGIVGATPPDLPFISSPRNVIMLDNLPELVQEQIDKLKKRGVNKIIFISQLQDINEDIALAAELTGLDIMLAGGGQELLANPDDILLPTDNIGNAFGPYPVVASGADGSDVLIITTTGEYKYVGRLLIGFNEKGKIVKIDDKSGIFRVAGGSNTDAVPPDPFIQSKVVDPIVDYTEALATNVIAQSAVALEGRREPGIRTMETNEGNLTADALFYQATLLASSFGEPLPDVAFQNSGGIRNNTLIPAGPITELTTFDIFPFANFVAIVPAVSREQFKELMEHSVSRIPVADGRFAQISGFEMVYDPAGTAQTLNPDSTIATPGTRVKEIILDDNTVIVTGGVVQPGAPIDIATIDFSAAGGDQFPFRGAPFTRLGVVYQQALFNYITDSALNGGLAGQITAAQYPEGGEGRITAAP
jgi:5'-nucleotidase